MKTKMAGFVSALKKHAPIPSPFVVRFVDGLLETTGHWAECSRHGGRTLLEIEASQTSDAATDALIHEWAHAMTYDCPGPIHGRAWGEAYSLCYRIVVEGWRPSKSARRRVCLEIAG